MTGKEWADGKEFGPRKPILSTGEVHWESYRDGGLSRSLRPFVLESGVGIADIVPLWARSVREERRRLKDFLKSKWPARPVVPCASWARGAMLNTRLGGATYRQIAQKFGVCVGYARQLTERAFNERYPVLRWPYTVPKSHAALRVMYDEWRAAHESMFDADWRIKADKTLRAIQQDTHVEPGGLNVRVPSRYR